MGKCKEYKIGDRIRIKKHERKSRYIGLEGEIVWRGHDSMQNVYQIETKTKPPYYRPAYPDRFIVTVHAREIQLIKRSEAE